MTDELTHTPPTADYSPDPTLTPQQHRIITLIASGQSITQAAATENPHRNTIGYWRRVVPAFARELEFATREQRLYWHEQATLLAPKAIQAIQSALTDPASTPSLRFRAAVLIMKMATDPQTKATQGFPALPAEVEAISGQMLGWRKEKQEREPAALAPAPTPDTTFDLVQAAQISIAAQNCTKPQPIRVTPEPGRNAPCPCGSNLKYKRCCANKRTQAAAA
jgi:hypothetical protein